MQLTDQLVWLWGASTVTSRALADLPAGPDRLAVWVNPAATVAIDAAGGASVTWSSRELCLWPGLDCLGFQAIELTTGEPIPGSPTAAWLEALGPEASAQLRAFDPHHAGVAEFPRYQRLADVTVDETARTVDATWIPCVGPGDFEVLAETTAPLQGGDTLAIQYGVLSDAACAPQRPGLILGTATPDCRLQASVLVDRLFGTLLVEASSATAACTSP
jgi:hypothetical protein